MRQMVGTAAARQTMATTVLTTQPQAQDDIAEHQRTYRRFVMGVTIFAGHVLAILLILGWVFSDSFG
jgi:Bacterial aa3 type cytochrome c oxidase subunit IV